MTTIRCRKSDRAVEKMRGSVRAKVTLTIRRKGQDKAIDVSLMRDIIRVRSVRSERKVTTSAISA